MKDKQFRQELQELRSKIALKDIDVMCNPKPYLQQAYDIASSLMDLFEKIEIALSPCAVFDFWQNNCNHSQIQKPVDITGEALIRCNAALKVIEKFKSGK